MVRLFSKKPRPMGHPPGSLLHPGQVGTEKVHLSVIEYTKDHCIETNDLSIDECLKHMEAPSMKWIEVSGISDVNAIESIGKQCQLHSLIIEDIVNPGQRSRLDVYQEQVFIIVRFLQYEEQTNTLKDEQISIVFGPNYLISFQESHQDIFKPVKDLLSQVNNRILKQGSDYLAYTLLDTVVDYYFIVLEQVDIHLDSLEEELIRFPKPATLHKMQYAKRDLIVLRKGIWPMRDVINRFLHLESPLLNPMTQPYLQDVYDHVVQIIDIIEGFRDVVAGMVDIYLSNINIRTNDIMKVLTIVATIFVPLTFICSIYGMNFKYMPELQYRWGYPIVLMVMASIAMGMLIFFRRKKWI